MIGASMAIMAASKFGGNINLSGALPFGNQATAFELSPTPATAGWYFRIDGSVDRTTGFGSPTEFNPTPDEWYDPNGSPDATYYIKATAASGDAPNGGSAMATVLALTTDRTWTWTRSAPGSRSGVILIEIFSDSGGTALLASGYYGGAATVDI